MIVSVRLYSMVELIGNKYIPVYKQRQTRLVGRDLGWWVEGGEGVSDRGYNEM